MSQASKTEERAPEGVFTRLEVSVVGVRVVVGEDSPLTVSAEPSVVDKIETRVVDGTLLVRPRKDTSFSTSVPILVRFSVSELQTVSASAGARVEIEGLSGPSFEVVAESGAQVKASGTVETLRATARSGGMVDLSRVRAVNVSSQCQSGGVVRGG